MSQERRNALRAKLKAKVDASKEEELQKLGPLRDEMFKKHTQGLKALQQDNYQVALKLFLECRISLLTILKSPYIKSFDQNFIGDLFGQIALCYYHLKKWQQCTTIAHEACQLKSSQPIENLANICMLNNEYEIAYQLLNTIYLVCKRFHSVNNLRIMGSLLFDGYGQVKNTQRYTLAIRFLEEAILNEVPDAHFNLGIVYHRCPVQQFRNRMKAIENYTLAANAGNASAYNQLGSLYAVPDTDDTSIGPDYLMALYHFKQAAKANFKIAYYNLAMVYDVRLNKPEKAIPWYQKAIEDCQCAKSMHNLGMIHENGEGTPVNPTLALSLFCKAADLGYEPSMSKAANMMMLTNTGVESDPINAEKYLRMAAAVNDVQGLHFLALYIYEKRFPSEDRLKEFLSLSLKAANFGKVESMLNYASTLDGILGVYSQSVHQWYETAADKDFTPAQVNLVLYLVTYSTHLIDTRQFTLEKLIEKIILTLKKIAASPDEISAKLASLQCQQIEQSDKSLSFLIELFSKDKPQVLSTLEHELQEISSEHKKSRRHRVAGILSRVRNTAWIDTNNIASALYYIGKIFEENSSIRDPFEENKHNIMRIVKIVTSDIEKLKPDSLVNIFIGLSKLHLHPDNSIMSECLQKLLPKLSQIIEETIFVNNRKVFYAATQFLFNCEHPSANEFTLGLLRLIQNPHAVLKMDGVQLTECAYFTMIYSHFHTIPSVELKETLIKLCEQISRTLIVLINDHRIIHQWFMINAFFKQQFSEPLTFIENSLKEQWDKMPTLTTKSHFEDKVEQCLIRLGIRFEREKVFNGIPVDFYLPDYDLVLETNGPRHYLYGLNNIVPTPRDIARNKLVGKVIAPICYLDWDQWENEQCCDQELFKIIDSFRQVKINLIH